MTEMNKGQYCHKCTHAREKVIPRVWICKIDCVQRNQTDVCLWDTKKNPSKFEPLPEATDEQENEQILAFALTRNIPICRDCGDLAVCDGMCQYPSRTEQIKANERKSVLDELNRWCKEESEFQKTQITRSASWWGYKFSKHIDSLRKGVK